MKLKKTISVVLSLLLILAVLPAKKALAAGTFNQDDIAKINSMIDEHPELFWAKAPTDGSGVPDGWADHVEWSTDLTDKRVVGIMINSLDLEGTLNLSGLPYMRYLNCDDNELTELNLSNLPALKFLYCSYNQLTGILNLSNFPALNKLECYENLLTGLNLSNLPALTELCCSNNQLSGMLDLSGLLNLEELDCSDNRMTGLNVSGLSNLRILHCDSNKLTGLNLSNLPALEYLDCSYNELTGLNLSNLPALYNLYCSCNQLTGILDVSGLPSLGVFECNDNFLTGLDVSGLLNLEELDCSDNQLTGLYLNNLPALMELYCSFNYITELNVSGLSALTKLSCNDNLLTGTLDVSGLPNLEFLECFFNNLERITLNGAAPYQYIDVSYNFLANSSAVTGQAISWDDNFYIFDPQYMLIDFDANGGSGIAYNYVTLDGEEFTLPENEFTAPEGKQFTAWAVGGIDGPRLNVGVVHIFTANTTVYAIWSDIASQQRLPWTKGSDQPLSFTSDADFNDLLGVKVDDEEVDENNYDAAEGSTIITFKPGFLETLSVGTHRVEIISKTGSVFGTLEIRESSPPEADPLSRTKTKVPRTGDNMNIYLRSGLLVFAVSALIFIARRKRMSQR